MRIQHIGGIGRTLIIGCCLVTLSWLFTLDPAAQGQSSKIRSLLIGTSGTLSPATTPAKEKAALTSLRNFIREETGLKNEIVRQKNWKELARKMSDGELPVGVFQGYEFAWAQAQDESLRPLAVALNGSPLQTALVVVREDDKVQDILGLEGQTLAIPRPVPPLGRLFLGRECQSKDRELDKLFGRIAVPDNVEEALDDVVDGKIRACCVDSAGLDGFRRRKPARARQLRELAKSPPVPGPIIAYYDKSLDSSTLQRFRSGLVRANRKERGQTLLTLFRLTGFAATPKDFAEALETTRMAYPPMQD